MTAASAPLPVDARAGAPPSRGRVGMVALITAESSLIAVFVVAYLFYAGKSLAGPTPREVLETPWLATLCLLSSSATVALAVRAVRAGRGRAASGWLALTWLLGAAFLLATAREWRRLIGDEALTIATNLFGTTFYSLVGLHAAHVAVGLSLLGILLACSLRRALGREHAERCELVAWYWHFVDAVWLVVFSVVYGIGR